MLAPVIAMKRLLTLIVLVLAFGTLALASSLPANGSVTVTNDQGAVVGTGTIVNGTLSLSLDQGTNGFVTLTVTNSTTNETETFQAMVKNGTAVTVVDGSQFKDLKSFAKDGGVDSVDVTESTENHASATGQQEKSDHAVSTSQEQENAQAKDHSQGNGQVSGSQTPDSHDTSASNDSSSKNDSTSGSETESSSGDTQVKVGASLDSHDSTDSGSTSTDTSVSGTASTGD